MWHCNLLFYFIGNQALPARNKPCFQLVNASANRKTGAQIRFRLRKRSDGCAEVKALSIELEAGSRKGKLVPQSGFWPRKTGE
jgi:hypothetical protein